MNIFLKNPNQVDYILQNNEKIMLILSFLPIKTSKNKKGREGCSIGRVLVCGFHDPSSIPGIHVKVE